MNPSVSTLVICDIQPAYKNSFTFNLNGFNKYLDNFSKIVVLYVGPELGCESRGEIARFYRRNGVSRANICRMTWHEKGYGFLRGWMDTGVDHNDIVKVGRRLIKHRKNDSRDLSGKAWKGLKELKDKPDNIYLPEMIKKMRSVNGATIIGGGQDECLAEVLLLADICKIKLEVDGRYVY